MVHLTKRQSNLVRHQGGCHCGAVRFEVLASPSLTVFECNCSICVKKQIKYFLVPFNQFKLVKGHHSLQTYSFNTHQAKYNFCITCGVQPFHIPSSNPEAYGIAMHCLDEGTVKKVTYEKVDGKKEAQAKRKTPSGDKTSSATLGGQKTDGKGQDQPLRKPSFIAMLNSWSQGQSTPSSAGSYADEKNQEESAQDPAATDTYRTRSKQSSSPTGTTNSTWYTTQDTDAATDANKTRPATTETATSARSTLDSTTTTTAAPSCAPYTLIPATTTIEGKSPKQSAHRRFIVTRVVESNPRSSPCL